MNKTRFLLVALTVVLAAVGLKAQNARADYNLHGDVAEITTHEVGQLDKVFTPETEKRVRALNIDGPINGDDIKVIQRILKRSSAVDNNGKSISTYVDLDLRYARIVGGGSSYYGSYRTEHDVVGNSMFMSCSHLRSVVLPERTRLIGDNAFRYCNNLEEVRMPRDVRSIGDHAFGGCYALNRISLSDAVETLGEGCFESCSSLRNLDLPRTLREIGPSCFKDTKMTQLNLPRNLTFLGQNALNNMPITSLYIPAATKIGNNYPGYLPNLTEFVVESGSRYYTYENGALFDASGEVLLLYPPKRGGAYTVPNGVKSISASAFAGTTLISVTMPSSVNKMGAGVFSNCKYLQLCDLSSSLKTIPTRTFKGCSNLRNINLPTGLATIDQEAFRESGLQSVVLPASVTSIGQGAFQECKSLSNVEFGSGLNTIGKEAFRDCQALTQVVIPSAATIEKEAFRGCKSLAVISLPELLASIGDNAFRETTIKTLDIPATVSTIGNKIAEKCKNLQMIVCRATTPPNLGKVSNNKVQVAVPAGTVEAYKSAKHWKEFKQIVEIGE